MGNCGRFCRNNFGGFHLRADRKPLMARRTRIGAACGFGGMAGDQSKCSWRKLSVLFGLWEVALGVGTALGVRAGLGVRIELAVNATDRVLFEAGVESLRQTSQSLFSHAATSISGHSFRDKLKQGREVRAREKK